MVKGKIFFWWKIVLTFASIIAAILTKSNIDYGNLFINHINPVLLKELLYDLSVGVFSSMVLVWFIDWISERISEKQSKSAERLQIIRSCEIVNILIGRYITLFYCVVTPLKSRNIAEAKMPNSFKFKDMRDMYGPSMNIYEGIVGISIDRFLEAEHSLRDQIMSTIRSVSFENFTEIRDILFKFIEMSLRYDCRGALAEVTNIFSDREQFVDNVRDTLENEADVFYERLLSGKVETTNLMHPYVILYEMMNKERDALSQYQREYDKLVLR